MADDYEIITFEKPAEWRAWLAAHHNDTPGVWVRFYKKASGVGTVTYAEALDHALCYGWIDGQCRSYDELSFLQKFTPRRKRSMWSKRNIEHIERLTSAGLMTEFGMQEVERAKADGRWDAAYDPPSTMTVPEDFIVLLRQHPKAMAFFETLNKTNKFAIAWRLRTARNPETLQRRQAKIIAMLETGEVF